MGLLAIQWNAMLSSAGIINAFCIGCLALLFACGLWIDPAFIAKQKHNETERISNTKNVLLRRERMETSVHSKKTQSTPFYSITQYNSNMQAYRFRKLRGVDVEQNWKLRNEKWAKVDEVKWMWTVNTHRRTRLHSTWERAGKGGGGESSQPVYMKW